MVEFTSFPPSAFFDNPTQQNRSPGGDLKVLVVSQHLMVLEALTAVLSTEHSFELVGATVPGSAVDLVMATRAHVAIVGIDAPERQGFDTVRRLRSATEVAVVALVAFSDEALELRALNSGCSALVTKGRSIDDLVAAVRGAARGDLTFPFSALQRLRDRTRNRTEGAELTERELQVLTLLGAAGATTTSIAAELNLSQHTVRNHVRNILGKLCARSRLEAVLKGHSLGIIELQDGRWSSGA